ncbi:MAG TPA: DUF4142 domain-containing protein [Kofleriaceae bacterium]|nr:DUF4142 domain-containing protein [Kofleriaceae bacterium]
MLAPRTGLRTRASLVLVLAAGLAGAAACDDNDDDIIGGITDQEVQAEVQQGESRGTALATQIDALMTPMTVEQESPVAGSIAVTVDQGEITQAQIALERAQDPEVRAFAEQMVREHTEHQAEQMALLEARGMAPADNEVSAALRADAAAGVAELEAASPATFDQTYMLLQVRMHSEAGIVVDELSQQVDDAELARFYDTTVPVIQEHRQRAIAIIDDRFGVR